MRDCRECPSAVSAARTETAENMKNDVPVSESNILAVIGAKCQEVTTRVHEQYPKVEVPCPLAAAKMTGLLLEEVQNA